MMRLPLVRPRSWYRQIARGFAVAGLLSCAAGEPIDGGLAPGNEIVGLQLTPENIELAADGTTEFTVTLELADGSTLPGLTVAYNATGGEITQDGNYTASHGAGTFQVVAQLGTVADTSIVTVLGDPEPDLIRISIDPGSAALLPGAVQRFTTSGIFSDSSIVPLTVDYAATGGSVTGSGSYTAGSTLGLFQVVASLKGGLLADTAVIEIGQSPTNLVRVEMTPASANLAYGQTLQFTAAGRLSDSTLVSLPVTWTATGGTVTANGIYTAGTTGGTYRIIARSSGGLADTSTITVSAPNITSLNLTPDVANLQVGQIQQFSVVATLSNGSTQQNPSVTYSFTGGLMTTGGLYTAGLIPGAYRVIARATNGVADTSNVNISLAILAAINLAPTTVSVQTGQSTQFTATGILSNNGIQPNPDVQWTAAGGTISSTGQFTAGTTPGTYQVRATNLLSAIAGNATVTIVTPPPVNMFFNSSEAGCGTDPNILLCDDFESRSWYSKDCDQANGSGGLLQTNGWCGTIFNASGLAGGTFRCGGLGIKSDCVATTGVMNGGTTGNMADHSLANNGGTEVWVRFYTKPLPGYQFGAEKMLTFNDGNAGGAGIRFGNLSWNCGGNTASTGTITMGFPVPMDVCQTQNQGNSLTITAGNWYFYEVHYRLSSPGGRDGVYELWLDNCGPNGTACPATPTLRMRRTDINNNRSASEAIRVLWFEAWSNPVSRGERYWDQIKVSRVGPIGFMP
jgi:hypothetical protein